MIKVSKQVDYAVQLLRALSKLKEGEFLSLRKFSKESTISFLFLQRIARSLKAAKIIDASRGIHGGYYFVLDPKKINMKQIVDAVDGNFGITACLRGQPCEREKTCTNKDIFHKMNIQVEQMFLETSII
ncbi:MAG: Rrf2 family transcriptional regulator [Candidatus Magasanikbacteria bacterium]|nr:Rrf2 family transcriptional regulator [Candidatus Magasanikbacteria bacterium]